VSRGVRRADATAAIETLAQAGAVDDGRLARARAARLAERGWGNAAIIARLHDAGISDEAVETALADLASEPIRAARLAADLPVRQAVAVLARRGFDPELVEEWSAGLDVEGQAEIRWKHIRFSTQMPARNGFSPNRTLEQYVRLQRKNETMKHSASRRRNARTRP
jgi:hypothetical protein